ncbi:hypothetical protein EVA_04991 [gut metagenome]|uniref:Uncharacterized protein n=1 Tax=gut metagenome TaxID=749906 RepID=J9GID9_9ZZZZ
MIVFSAGRCSNPYNSVLFGVITPFSSTVAISLAFLTGNPIQTVDITRVICVSI